MYDISLPGALIVTFLLLLVLYLIPITGRNQSHPIINQIQGVTAVGLIFSWWAFTNPHALQWFHYWLFFIAGGLPSLLGLLLDKLDQWINQQHAAQAIMQAMGEGHGKN